MTNMIDEKVGTLMEIVYRLSEILTEETVLLKEHAVPDILPIQESKGLLMEAYENSVTDLQSDPEALEALQPERKAHLKAAMEKFAEMLVKNAHALKAARDGRQFMLETIREAAISQQNHVGAYTKNGVQGTSLYKSQSNSMPAVALNESL